MGGCGLGLYIHIDFISRAVLRVQGVGSMRVCTGYMGLEYSFCEPLVYCGATILCRWFSFHSRWLYPLVGSEVTCKVYKHLA